MMSESIQSPVIIPIMHSDSEQYNGKVKRNAHGIKWPVINLISVCACLFVCVCVCVCSLCCVRAAHLLCDGKANNGVSLGDVPCHHGRVRFHRFDGHIGRRRQAICREREREREGEREREREREGERERKANEDRKTKHFLRHCRLVGCKRLKTVCEVKFVRLERLKLSLRKFKFC